MVLVLFIISTVSVFISAAIVSSRADQINTYQYFCRDNSSQEKAIFHGSVTCQPHKSTWKGSVTVLESFCLNYNIKKRKFGAGICFFTKKRKVLPKNIKDVFTFNEDVMCAEQNRAGMLCGKCKDNFSVAITSYQYNCMDSEKCHGYNWLLFLLANSVPVTIMFVIVILFDIKLTSGYANTYILLAQFLSLQTNVIHISSGLGYIIKNQKTDWKITKFMESFYSLWSLDLATTLFPDICVGHSIGNIDSIALQYFPAFYSLSLVFVTCCLVELHANNYRVIVVMWKPFRKCFSRIRRHINPRASLINAFATFLVLSHSKLTVTSLLLLMPARLWNETGHHVSTVLFYDGTVEYLGSTYHKCLFSLAIFVLITFVFFPPLLLLLYPWQIFQKLLTKLHLHRPGLIILMDCFQGCYKDGNNGSRDFRWFSAVYFLLRIIIFSCLIIFWSPWSYTFDPLVQLEEHIMLVTFVLMLTYIDPYKCSVYTKLDITVFTYVMLLTVFNSYNLNEINLRNPNYKVSEPLMMVFLSLPALTATLLVSCYCIKRLYVFLINFFNHQLCSRLPDWVLAQEINEERSPLLSDKCCTSDIPDRLLHPSEYTDTISFDTESY